METYQIAELARRTGFSRPTLRYYEEIGLLERPKRSAVGYRVYDRDDESRLQFIGRAKRLGLSLEEIRDLVEVWAGGQCTTTRRHLGELVERKIFAVREQAEECLTFLRQLEAVIDRLALVPDASEGCDCAPELPHMAAVHIDLDLTAHDQNERRIAMSTNSPEERPTTETQCGCGCATTTAAEAGTATATTCSCDCAPDAGSECACANETVAAGASVLPHE